MLYLQKIYKNFTNTTPVKEEHLQRIHDVTILRIYFKFWINEKKTQNDEAAEEATRHGCFKFWINEKKNSK